MKVKIIGGLGNQMFQYATAFAISRRTKQELIVDISDALNYKVHPLRLTELSCTCIYEDRSFFLEKYLYSSIIPHLIRKAIMPGYYIEKDLLYDNGIDCSSYGKKIVGYFQSEKYFSDYRKDLINEFKPKAEFNQYQTEMRNLIRQNQSCSVHIRRGDYISNISANNTHGVCSSEYFAKAIRYFESNRIANSNFTLFVFSDDIEWCEKNITFPYRTVFVQGDDERVELDMWLMSLCNHNIISNSSFSWWGAWLNENTDKKVIAPQQWFKKNFAHNIVPESWVKL